MSYPSDMAKRFEVAIFPGFNEFASVEIREYISFSKTFLTVLYINLIISTPSSKNLGYFDK